MWNNRIFENSSRLLLKLTADSIMLNLTKNRAAPWMSHKNVHIKIDYVKHFLIKMLKHNEYTMKCLLTYSIVRGGQFVDEFSNIETYVSQGHRLVLGISRKICVLDLALHVCSTTLIL